LSAWNPKAPPERTPAWHTVVSAGVSDGDLELADLLDEIGRPPAFTLGILIDHLRKSQGLQSALRQDGILGELLDRKNRSRWPARMAAAGYTAIRNRGKEGDWRVNGKRQTVYTLKDATEGQRLSAAAALAAAPPTPPPAPPPLPGMSI